MDVRVTGDYVKFESQPPILILNLGASDGGESRLPLVHFDVTVRERECCGTVVITRRISHPGSLMSIAKARIINAVRVLVEKDPGLRGTGKSHLRHLFDM